MATDELPDFVRFADLRFPQLTIVRMTRFKATASIFQTLPAMFAVAFAMSTASSYAQDGDGLNYDEVTTPGVTTTPAVAAVPAVGDDGFGDEVGTAAGDILESRGDLLKDAGKAMLFRSLSAEQFQEAIDKRLDNRRERVSTYFELRDLNDEERKDDRYNLTMEQRNAIAKRKSPDRLTEKEIDVQSGQIRWIGPLAADALKAYRKPIEESFAKRGDPGQTYGKFDHFKVARMVNLMSEALESVKDRMDTKEYLALEKYLNRIKFESRFDSQNKRVDY